jgi:GMP synthase-like glutamine amidotransferase
MRFLSVVQHSQSEWLGAIEDHLEGRGIRFGYFRPFATGGALPKIDTIGDGLILVGGGPWGAAPGPRQLPTLELEVRLARACLMLGKPVLAMGLGAQILSLGADGGVEPAPYTLQISTAVRKSPDGLGGLMPERFPMVIAARDRPSPPAYGEILAIDLDGQPAAFQIGGNAFGFAGHLGVRRAMIEELVMEFEEAPENAAEGLAAMAGLQPAIEDALVTLMAGIIQQWGW